MSLNQNAPLRHDVFKLTREFELVRRVDCAGREKTSRVTVKDPKDAYSISAQTLAADGSQYEVSALNRTTCSYGRIKARKPTDTRMEVQTHSSPNTGRMYLIRGAKNIVDYEFRRCLARDAQNKCVKSELAERGTVVLDVQYSELQHPGVRESKDNCPP